MSQDWYELRAAKAKLLGIFGSLLKDVKCR
jgi:hypothetical protein